jgi:hypothetical protein
MSFEVNGKLQLITSPECLQKGAEGGTTTVLQEMRASKRCIHQFAVSCSLINNSLG